ncbi:putative transporter [Candidatus Spyradosoma sp. SGI.093]|uniref:putative transporter n=1 Tax=Candidatus Spyradosoma sp. SGI.093 TaxID=3420583 RepID=UPI003D002872
MDWIINLFYADTNGVAHTVLLFCIAIAIGIPLGRIKVFGISLGITLVLFVAILLGQLGFSVNGNVLHFVKEFGLILFVFTIGLQVGPGFFASFKKGGMLMNGLAASVVLLGVLLTIVFHFLTGIPMPTMVGVLSGAITNTPGLGAAQQALAEIVKTNPEATDGAIERLAGTLGQGYACAYPLGVVGIILSLIVVRAVFKISLDKETAAIKALEKEQGDTSAAISLEVQNPAIIGKKISEITRLFSRPFVISRHRRGENAPTVATGDTVLAAGDRLFVIVFKEDAEMVGAFFGKVINWGVEDWEHIKSAIVRRRIIVTRENMNGRPLSRLAAYTAMGVAITRINRAGVVQVASPTLRLQIGDRVNVVGPEHAVNEVEKVLGNELKRLDHPNLVSIFLGIALGVFFGSIPFAVPGLSQPLKLGLAGGPLIIAILISCWGYKSHLVTYTPIAANLMIREIGILLFLASVGLGAGDGFLQAVIGGGYWWVLIGFCITTVPLLVVGFVARGVFRLNYYSVMGLVAGATTDPPALAYANSVAQNEAPNVAYATVYPLTMFLRVLTAQLLILVFCS